MYSSWDMYNELLTQCNVFFWKKYGIEKLIIINPLLPSVLYMPLSAKFFYFNLRRDHQKNFLWASRLWVRRRKEPILCYVPKNYVKNNSCSKGLSIMFNLLRSKGLSEIISIWKKLENGRRSLLPAVLYLRYCWLNRCQCNSELMESLLLIF